MIKKINPEAFISLSKHFLYGDSDIETEIILSSKNDRLKNFGLLEALPDHLKSALYRNIINRIYYGAFHYALKKTTIKITVKGDAVRIHSKVIKLLNNEDPYASRSLKDLKNLRVFADYDAGYQQPMTWRTCHNMMKKALLLIRRLGFDVLQVSMNTLNPFKNRRSFATCDSDEFSCRKKDHLRIL